MERCAEGLDAQRARLDSMNVYPVPDGDTGTNLAVTFKAVVAELDGTDSDMRATCLALVRGALMGARGNSGVIVSQVLRGACEVWAGADVIDGATLAAGFRAAAGAAREAVAAPVEGTILTVLDSAAAAATQQAERLADRAAVGSVASVARRAAAVALEATPTQLAALAAAGVVDAGGAGWLVALDELAALTGADVGSGFGVTDSGAAEAHGAPHPETAGTGGRSPAAQIAYLGPRFELSCILEVEGAAADELRRRWEELGESVVVGGAADLWACHVHTDDVEGALAVVTALGSPRSVEVTDLHAQAGRDDVGRRG